MFVPLSYNVRSLFVRKATTIATALGIGLVVFVLASALMLSRGIRETLVSTGAHDRAIVLRKGADAELASSIETKSLGIILAAPGVAQTNGVPIGSGEVVVVLLLDKLGTEGQVSNVQVRGVTPMSYQLRKELKIVEGRPAQPGTDEVVIGSALQGRFRGMEVGQSFELKKNRPVNVVGVFDSGGSGMESEIWSDVETLKSTFGREGVVSSVLVQLETDAKYDAFAAAIEHDKQLGLQVYREDAYYEKQSEGTSIFISALGIAVAFFFSLGAMIGAMITMYSAVANRRREIGTLRALGFGKFSIMSSFLLESVMLALIGGGFGALASCAMGFVHFSVLNFQSWSEMVFRFQPTPGIVLGSLIFAGVMGVAGGLFPAVRAARLPLIKALKD